MKPPQQVVMLLPPTAVATTTMARMRATTTTTTTMMTTTTTMAAAAARAPLIWPKLRPMQKLPLPPQLPPPLLHFPPATACAGSAQNLRAAAAAAAAAATAALPRPSRRHRCRRCSTRAHLARRCRRLRQPRRIRRSCAQPRQGTIAAALTPTRCAATLATHSRCPVTSARMAMATAFRHRHTARGATPAAPHSKRWPAAARPPLKPGDAASARRCRTRLHELQTLARAAKAACRRLLATMLTWKTLSAKSSSRLSRATAEQPTASSLRGSWCEPSVICAALRLQSWRGSGLDFNTTAAFTLSLSHPCSLARLEPRHVEAAAAGCCTAATRHELLVCAELVVVGQLLTARDAAQSIDKDSSAAARRTTLGRARRREQLVLSRQE